MTGTLPVSTNLSYVLHEPSTSPRIAEYGRRIEARQSRIAALLDRLGSLGEERLRGRVIVDPRKWAILEELKRNEQPIAIFSLRLGVWRLLSQILQATAGISSPVTLFDTASEFQKSSGFTWFRAPSLIGQPAPHTSTRPAYFVLAIVRPGDETILLDVERITRKVAGSDDAVTEPAVWPAQLRDATENAVRSYLDQWCCDLPLWGVPAEAALPEFQVE